MSNWENQSDNTAPMLSNLGKSILTVLVVLVLVGLALLIPKKESTDQPRDGELTYAEWKANYAPQREAGLYIKSDSHVGCSDWEVFGRLIKVARVKDTSGFDAIYRRNDCIIWPNGQRVRNEDSAVGARCLTAWGSGGRCYWTSSHAVMEVR